MCVHVSFKMPKFTHFLPNIADKKSTKNSKFHMKKGMKEFLLTILFDSRFHNFCAKTFQVVLDFLNLSIIVQQNGNKGIFGCIILIGCMTL